MPPMVVLAALLLCAAPAAQPLEDTRVAGLARTAVGHLTAGEYGPLIEMFDDKMRAVLTEAQLRTAWESMVTQAGAFERVGEPRVETKGEYTSVVFPAEFANARVDIIVAFTRDGRIGGLNMRPGAPVAPFADAAYVSSARFTERDVTVDAGGWPLPGTLAVPTGPGPFPAVVLVHGSGVVDRDATLGPNKVFRDLARGLASRGIAVLRYEKRTRQHGAKVRPLTDFTVKEETIDDAAAAVALLRKTAGIDPKRVFVLGHSLGGMLAPRIATAAPEAAGFIIMAGAVRSLPQSLIDQTRYLAMADGTISAEEQRQIDQFEELKQQAETVKPTDPPVSVGPIAAPAAYWADLRGYDPPAAAAAVKRPMLILQGERDYQVTVEDFAKWKAAVGARKDVTMKSYPALNHLFIAGEGRSLPGEYFVAGHVAEDVIADIAQWIGAH